MTVTIVDPRVDYLRQPLGLQNPRPRFSWRLESRRRNVRQRSYRILVASSAAALEQGRADLWDSGRVVSSRTFDIPYRGKDLESRQQCFWRVAAWDEQGNVCDPSPIATWEMGLLSPDDWRGEWLAVEDEQARADRQFGLNWIWGETQNDPAPRKFRFTFELPHQARTGFLLVGSKDRRHKVWVDSKEIPLPPLRSKFTTGMLPLSEIELPSLAHGSHLLAVEVLAERVLSDNPPDGLTVFMRVELEDGRTLRFDARSGCRTSLTADGDWFEQAYDDNEWPLAQPAEPLASPPWPPAPAMQLRKEFAVNKPLAQARLYTTAWGAYEARLNGQRVGDALLLPEVTLYSTRTFYRVHDVTNLLRDGSNAIGLLVGDGWYASVFRGVGRYAFGAPPRRTLAQLELTYADGSREVIATGPDWRITQSPILRSEIFDGEVYDARREQPGWDQAGFDDSRWEHAAVLARPSCQLDGHASPPIRVTQVLKPRAITTPSPGVQVVDFGQNFTGWCRLKVRGAAGTRIEMRFGELLSASGHIDQFNLITAKQTDVFILRGEGREEVFEPRFTFHGFRYVQVSGLEGPLGSDAIEALVIHSDLPFTGNLRIGNALIDRIWRNTVWTQRSDFIGTPIDCPQRDERRAYPADAAIFWDAAAFNMDVAAFTRRYLQDIADSQSPEGIVQTHAPTPISRPNPFPGWSDGPIYLVWTAWQRYGDSALIERSWPTFKRHLAFLQRHNPDYVWRRRHADYGDWLSVDQEHLGHLGSTPHDLMGTAFWAEDARLMARMADALGWTEEAEELRALHEKVRRAFIDNFVKPDGRVGNGSQTGYVLALLYDLLPSELRPKAVEHLVADIRRRGKALSTGIWGTAYLLDVLAESGNTEIAYDLLLRKEYPSWGYMIEKRATTIWESWNERIHLSDAFGGEPMPNSYNHYTLGSVCGFMFRRIAAIEPGAPGFERIVIRPVLDKRVRRGGGDYDSIVGRISTDWEQTPEGDFVLTAVIPANATARIHLPARRSDRIDADGVEISSDSTVRLERLDHEAVVEVGSGEYRFKVSAACGT